MDGNWNTMADALKELEPEPKMVSIEKRCIYILPARYPIDIIDCNTYKKICGWVFRLSRKAWITPAAIEQFIEAACEENHLEFELKWR